MPRIPRTLKRVVARVAGAIVPGKSGLVVFHSNPDYSGNARALYSYLKENHPECTCVWLISSPTVQARLAGRGIVSALQDSPQGLLWLARAAVVATTHGHSMMDVLHRPLYLNLWHGFSVKGVDFTDRRATREVLRRKRSFGGRVDLAVAASELSRSVIAASHSIDPRKIAVTGYPRNDWLVADEGRRNLEKFLGLSLEGRKVVLYAPTFRDTVEGRDGEAVRPMEPIRELVEGRALADFLRQQKALCIVKLHPKDETSADGLTNELAPPFYRLTSEALLEADLDFFQVLGGMDALITDFSSVYTDYLLLNRPVVFYVPELQRYREARGFKLEPVEFWMAGPRVSSPEDVVRQVDLCLSDPRLYDRERAQVTAVLHRYRDGRSSERTWSEVRRRTGSIGMSPEKPGPTMVRENQVGSSSRAAGET